MWDARNLEALSYGREYMLAKFANLPATPTNIEPAVEFQRRFGILFPGVPPGRYWEHAKHFRDAWKAKTSGKLENIGTYLESVFNRTVFHRALELKSPDWSDVLAGPQVVMDGEVPKIAALKVDFSTGQLSLKPHATLLDWLAESLLECRHRLGICERAGCVTPYFVKSHPRARYCSELCFRESRNEKKNQWWKRNRGKGAKHSAAKTTGEAKRKRGQR